MDQNKYQACPTCNKGKVIKHYPSYIISLELDVVLCHMNDCTLETYHSEVIPYLFFVMARESIESLKVWIQTFGIPTVNLWSGTAATAVRWKIPKKNFIYILNNGLDPNIFFTAKDLDNLNVDGMRCVDLIKLLLQFEYKFPPYHTQNNSLLDGLHNFDIDEFMEATELCNFTEIDAKLFISKQLYLDGVVDVLCFPYIEYLSNKFGLRDYVLSCPMMRQICNFIDSLVH